MRMLILILLVFSSIVNSQSKVEWYETGIKEPGIYCIMGDPDFKVYLKNAVTLTSRSTIISSTGNIVHVDDAKVLKPCPKKDKE